MRPIMPLELAGNDKLDFDLYDENGKVIYNAGDPLTASLLMSISYKKVFMVPKRSSDETIQSSIMKIPDYLIHKPVISDKTAAVLVQNTKNILKNVYENEKPNLEECRDAANIIIDEVSTKLEKIECISQLRIFDEYTFSHCVNVSSMSSALGMILDFGEEQIKDLALAALLHDIGKMRVPHDILNKPAKLDPDEFEIMKSHTLLGYKYLLEKMDINDKIAKVALDHQEKYNGGGYPNNLKGKEINLFAQAVTIADVFDALISNRVYKKGMPADAAVEIMTVSDVNSFNPYMLDKFLKLIDYQKHR